MEQEEEGEEEEEEEEEEEQEGVAGPGGRSEGGSSEAPCLVSTCDVATNQSALVALCKSQERGLLPSPSQRTSRNTWRSASSSKTPEVLDDVSCASP